MTVAAELDQLIDDITAAYEALAEAGATLPADKNTENLVTTIEDLIGLDS